MSENWNRNPQDFSRYDTMTTEELETILRLDSEMLEGQESDTEAILYIAEVLAKRENKKYTGKTARESWESFEKNYLSVEEEPVEYIAESKRVARPWVRRMIAVAATLVLLVGVSATVVSALGWENIWNTVAKWAKGTFSFVSNDDAELNEPKDKTIQEYTSLQEALEATGHRNDFIPKRLPDGYVLDELVIEENPMQSVYIADYQKGSKGMKIVVQSYMNADSEKVEINDLLVEMYEVAGIEYYIFKNDIQLCAVWMTGSYECYISGELTVEEIKTMIDSIGKESI